MLYSPAIAKVLRKIIVRNGLRTVECRLLIVVTSIGILYDLRRCAETVDGYHMVRSMALIKMRKVRTSRNSHILVKSFVVKKDMIVLAVVQESIQKGLGAGRSGTRQPYDTRRQRDRVESLE
jgi:hypothetical protein